MVAPAVPPILDADRYVAYNPVTATADFNISFPLFGDATDITVYIAGIKQTSGFTVLSPSGALNTLIRPLTDAYVHLDTAVTGVKVEIYGSFRPRRTSQASAAYSRRDFDYVFSLLMSIMRELWSQFTRAVQVPIGEASVIFPGLADRKAKVLGFDATTGDPKAVTPGSAGVPSSTDIADATAIGRSLLTAATSAVVTAIINAFSSDDGTNPGVKGLVPAPAAGDAALSKVLGVTGWRTIPTVANMPGSFLGLKIQVTGDTALTLAASAVALTDGSNYRAVQGVSLTLGTGTTGANALDTGTVANSTWYAVWLIVKPDGTTAGLLSTSATSPIMPSGYTYKTRLGWVRTDSSGKLLRTLQQGRVAQYVVTSGVGLPVMASTGAGSPSTPTWVAVAVANFIPTTATRIHGVLAMSIPGSGTLQAIVAPNNSYGPIASLTNPPAVASSSVAGNGNYASPQFSFAVEGSSIYWASSQSGAAVVCLGWEDGL